MIDDVINPPWRIDNAFVLVPKDEGSNLARARFLCVYLLVVFVLRYKISIEKLVKC